MSYSFPKLNLMVLAAGLMALLLSCQGDQPQKRTGKKTGADQDAIDNDGGRDPQNDSDNDSDSENGRNDNNNESESDSESEEPTQDSEDAGDEEEGSGEWMDGGRKSISFRGERNDEVPGYLWIPRHRDGKKHPAVLLMYGIKGSKDDRTIGRAAEILSENGYVALTIDWPGTGSRGNIGNQQRITNPDIKDWTLQDYKKAFDYLKTRREVDGSRLGYIGASMGAMTGLAFAAADNRVKAIAAVVPIPNPLWGTDDPLSSIQRLAPRPVLCISTQNNIDFSGLVCKNAGAGATEKTLPGGHELEGFEGQVVEEVQSFLDRHLK